MSLLNLNLSNTSITVDTALLSEVAHLFITFKRLLTPQLLKESWFRLIQILLYDFKARFLSFFLSCLCLLCTDSGILIVSPYLQEQNCITKHPLSGRIFLMFISQI